MVALLLITALFSPDVPASMPAEAAACVAALKAPALPTAADRHLPGPCSHTGAVPNRFSYQTESGMALAGDAGPDGEKVVLGDAAHPIQRTQLKAGEPIATTTLAYSGTRLITEFRKAGPKDCPETTEIVHSFGDFGRPTAHKTTVTPCKGAPKTTTETLSWQADGTAKTSSATVKDARYANGLVEDQWFSVTCEGSACSCERRTYDTHHNLLRSRSRDTKGTITELRYDFACWPKKTPTKGPKAGDATKGKQLYTIFCAACHGPKGHGDGPAAGEMRVRNLASMGDAMCGQTNAILHTIKNGVADMPGFPSLTEAQGRDLVAYIRELQRKK